MDSSVVARYRNIIWPIAGTVTSPFGWRVHPVFGEQRWHKGIDISIEYGAPVLAAKSGKIIYAGWIEEVMVRR